MTQREFITKEEHREKLYRLYLDFQSEEMADCRDPVAYQAARVAYHNEQNNYWLQWGERWSYRDTEAMWAEKNKVMA